MHIVQLLLPLYDNDGNAFPESLMARAREELVARFGGVTAFSRTPAEGVWSHHGQKVRDDVVLVEVMVKELDRAWWARFRAEWEKTLRQDLLVVRSFPVERRNLLAKWFASCLKGSPNRAMEPQVFDALVESLEDVAEF